jgi:hypothetical protein
MGFISFTPPPFDLDEWKAKPHLERIKPLAQDWAVNGFGTPTAVYLLYIFKLVVFSLGALLVISTTPGIGGLGDFGDWWTEPIVFQKLVVWTLLWEVLGIGSGSMPLTFRFAPPVGGFLYWLRPGTLRLAPWPDKVPLTAGTRRTILDVALYTGVLVSGVVLLLSDGPLLDETGIAVVLGLLALLGLRDKVPFLAARPEVYGFMLLVGVFPAENFIVAWQFIFFFIWWGAASSKLNRHFPYVVSVMISNTPWNPSRKAKSRLWRGHPEDVRPGPVAAYSAHLGTVIEFGLPLVLILSKGGTIGTIAVAGMVIFHVHILSTFPLGVPLEWNIFMIFGVLFLFGHYGDVPLDTLGDPLLIATLLIGGVGIPVLGNLRPDLISFLPSMRYYAGNWATSQWLFRKDGAEDKFDERLDKVAPVVVKQLAGVYDEELAEFMLYKGLAFRAMHSHGRALNGLLPRAVDDISEYHIREGEFVAGVAIGWNFGDGHFHDERLLAAIQEQVGFEEGEVRLVYLESQPAHVQRQHYRIYDAATGLIEEGWVDVADMVERHPWLDDTGTIPVRT